MLNISPDTVCVDCQNAVWQSPAPALKEAPTVRVYCRLMHAFVDESLTSCDSQAPMPAVGIMTTKDEVMQQVFSIGDMVKWTSSSNGRTTVKAGQVEAVILAKERLTLQQSEEADATGLPRNHASYLVRVKNKSGRGKGKLYWPRVNQLAICAS